MKRLLLAVLLLLLVAVATVWLTWPRLTEALRLRTQEVVSEALGRPARIEHLSVSVFPIRVRLTGAVLGNHPAVLADAGTIEVRLWALESLTELRPVVSIHAESVDVDMEQFPPQRGGPRSPEQRPGRLPALRIKHFELEQGSVHFRLKQADTRLALARATAELQSRPRPQRLTATLEMSGIALERLDQQVVWTEVRLRGG